jgi:two-component system, OmpR family, phosphate regulon response regulator PhoB
VHKGNPRLPTVLLVEDDPAALRFYADALRASGFLVQEASSGAQALRSAEADGPSVIVADLGLPDFDGFEVCRQVKLRPDTRQVPVIAITGRAMALRDIELAEEVGFHAVIIKPCPPEALVAAVGKALNGSRTVT